MSERNNSIFQRERKSTKRKEIQLNKDVKEILYL